jgi:hypothetical protein
VGAKTTGVREEYGMRKTLYNWSTETLRRGYDEESGESMKTFLNDKAKMDLYKVLAPLLSLLFAIPIFLPANNYLFNP